MCIRDRRRYVRYGCEAWDRLRSFRLICERHSRRHENLFLGRGWRFDNYSGSYEQGVYVIRYESNGHEYAGRPTRREFNKSILSNSFRTITERSYYVCRNHPLWSTISTFSSLRKHKPSRMFSFMNKFKRTSLRQLWTIGRIEKTISSTNEGRQIDHYALALFVA